jgi:hypothetical protein
MIATAHSRCSIPNLDDLHVTFLSLAPRIELHATIFFRHVRCPHHREDAISETLALAWKWFVRLIERGKEPSQFVSTLATYAARAVNSGRRLCGQERAQDVMSPVAQRRHGFVVERLPSSTATSHESLYGAVLGQHLHDAFEERLADNTRTPVPDQAAFRIDFPSWYVTLTERDRRLVDNLITGERPGDVARRFGLSAGRVSQKRREFHEDWQRFHNGNYHFSGGDFASLA